MKKINWRLIAVFLIAISVAFTTRKNIPTDMHHYSFLYTDMTQQKYYVYRDLTAMGWVQGDQYDCNNISYICTLIANPIKLHHDLSGSYFLASDVPTSGINWGGIFILMPE